MERGILCCGMMMGSASMYCTCTWTSSTVCAYGQNTSPLQSVCRIICLIGSAKLLLPDLSNCCISTWVLGVPRLLVINWISVTSPLLCVCWLNRGPCEWHIKKPVCCLQGRGCAFFLARLSFLGRLSLTPSTALSCCPWLLVKRRCS